jgi:hypothetical protein
MELSYFVAWVSQENACDIDYSLYVCNDITFFTDLLRLAATLAIQVPVRSSSSQLAEINFESRPLAVTVTPLALTVS